MPRENRRARLGTDLGEIRVTWALSGCVVRKLCTGTQLSVVVWHNRTADIVRTLKRLDNLVTQFWAMFDESSQCTIVLPDECIGYGLVVPFPAYGRRVRRFGFA